MKNKILASALTLAIVILSLCSCELIFGDVAETGDVTVVIENTDGSYDVFEVDLEKVENKSEGAKGILEYLSKGSDPLYVDMADSSYGAYVSAIGNIRENTAEGKYVIVYTSGAADSYEGAPTVQYKDVTMYQAGVGLSGMSVEVGTIILFRLEVSPY